MLEFARTTDMTLTELAEKITAERGVAVGADGGVGVLGQRRSDCQKKTAHAEEQEPPDVLRRQRDWFEAQPDFDPERLVFIDETWASTNMARRHGRAPSGERLRAAVPHGHWKTTTFVAGLRLTGMVAPMA